MIRIPLMGDSNTISHGVPRSAIIDILQPRVEEMLLHVRQKLQKIEKTSLGTQRLVLTGGGSQLPGFREFAQERLGRSIRLGKPTAISGVPGGDRPEFATTVGLLSYVETEEFKRMSGFLSQNRRGVSFFRQMTSWFKENL
jgi:cell division protein FtsA